MIARRGDLDGFENWMIGAFEVEGISWINIIWSRGVHALSHDAPGRAPMQLPARSARDSPIQFAREFFARPHSDGAHPPRSDSDRLTRPRGAMAQESPHFSWRGRHTFARTRRHNPGPNNWELAGPR